MSVHDNQPLLEFVRDYGPEKFMKDVGIDRQSLYRWLSRRFYPKVETMRKMVQVTKGKLTYEMIIESCAPLPKTRGRKPDPVYSTYLMP